MLDPWKTGPYVYCPEQFFSECESLTQVNWRIYAHGQLQEQIATELSQSESGLKSQAEIIPLHRCAAEYRVELVSVQRKANDNCEKIHRVWQLSGFSEKCPLLLFDGETKRAIEVGDSIHGRSLWIFHPRDVRLLANPPGSLVLREELPPLPSEWRSLVGKVIDLTDARRLVVTKKNNRIVDFPIVRTDSEAQPRLEGEHLFQNEQSPLYVGHPPAIKFPFLTPESPLHLWHVEIRSEQPANPNIQKTTTLDKLKESLDFRREHALLNLGKFLGTTPMGHYCVKIRNPLDVQTELQFRILPVLEIIGYEKLYLPDSSSKRVTFLIKTLKRHRILSKSGIGNCRIKSQDTLGRLHQVTANIQAVRIPLRIVEQVDDGRKAIVDFSIPIRCLRWKICLTRQDISAKQWRTSPSHLSLQALEQSTKPFILLDLFAGTVENLLVKMYLEDLNSGERLQEQIVEHKPRQRHRYAELDLRPFLDTMRDNRASSLIFRLVVRNLPQHPDPLDFPVAVITKKPVIEHARMDAIWDSNIAHVTLH